MPQQFASDNNAGMCPQALDALIRANAEGHVTGYGDDPWTEKACDAHARAVRDGLRGVLRLQRHGGQCPGAGADLPVLSRRDRPCVRATSRRTRPARRAVFAAAPRSLTADTPLAKLTPEAVEPWRRKAAASTRQAARAVAHAGDGARHGLHRRRDRRSRRGGAPPRPQGAHGRGALRQCGGHRSAARRPISPGAPASTCCASAASRTGSPSARPCCSSIASLAREFEWRVKQAGHLNSKMRLVTAPWLGLLENDVWLKNARHANAMAQRLAERIAGLDGVRPIAPVRDRTACSWSCRRPCRSGCASRAGASNAWGETGCRLMCAWDTDAGHGRPLRGRLGGRRLPPPPSPRLRGEGRGEGQRTDAGVAAAPHPNPLPTEEWGEGIRPATSSPAWPADRRPRRPASPWWRPGA